MARSVPSLLRSAPELLSQYARYHRDRRNVLTHFIGVPLIVLGVALLLSGGGLAVAGFTLTAAWLVVGLATLWYLTRGAPVLGLATSAAVIVLTLLAHRISAGSWSAALGWGAGFFIVGWIIQFIGHYYEGRKPAFADDLIGLLVAPMFVVLEALAPLGFFKPLLAHIEAEAGPLVIRDLAHPATTR